MLKLREFQELGVERIMRAFETVRRVVAVAPTGSGKTCVACAVILRAIRQGKFCLFVAHRKELIDQIVAMLKIFGIECGVIMGNHALHRPEAMVQVASIQTLMAMRGCPSCKGSADLKVSCNVCGGNGRIKSRSLPRADVIIVDEAHRVLGPQYQSLIGMYPEAAVLALTATPWRLDGKGLGAIFKTMFVLADMRELIGAGYLLPLRVFTGPPDLDLKSVRISNGDYNAGDLAKVMSTRSLIGNIVDHYGRLGGGQRGVTFATTVAHSMDLTARFVAEGIKAEHIDGTMAKPQREGVLKRLSSGETRMVCNVDILCLDDQTEILTSNGFRNIDEISKESQVANWYSDGTIIFEAPHAIVRRQRKTDERMVCVHGRYTDIRVTEDHRIILRKKDSPAHTIVRARDLVGRRFWLPRAGVAAPGHVDMPLEPVTKKPYQKRITATSYVLRLKGMSHSAALEEATRRKGVRDALRYTRPEDLTIDECRLIGFWVGDGCCAHLQSGGVEYSVSQSMAYPAIVTWVDDLFERLGVSICRRFTEARPKPEDTKKPWSPHRQIKWSFCRGTGSGVQQRHGVFHLEPYLKKSGTALWWGLDETQFDALIEGFWLADGLHHDGTTRPKGKRLYGTNVELMDLLQAIACCRGYLTCLRPQKVTDPRLKQMNYLRCTKVIDRELVRDLLQFEVEPWKPERVWCVSTTSGFIVTRRNGRVAVLGNCEGWDLPSLHCVALARPTKSITRYLQQVGRAMRPFEGQSYALILDHANCVAEHGLPQDFRKWSLEDRRGVGRDRSEGSAEPKRCPKCQMWISGAGCPACSPELFADAFKEIDVALVEVYAEAEQAVMLSDEEKEIARAERDYYEQQVADAKRSKPAIEKPARVRRENPPCMSCASTSVKQKTFGGFRLRRTCSECGEIEWTIDTEAVKAATPAAKRAEWTRLEAVRREKGFQSGWTAHQYRATFGSWPPAAFSDPKAEQNPVW